MQDKVELIVLHSKNLNFIYLNFQQTLNQEEYKLRLKNEKKKTHFNL
jgi:hypothetical protein